MGTAPLLSLPLKDRNKRVKDLGAATHEFFKDQAAKVIPQIVDWVQHRKHGWAKKLAKADDQPDENKKLDFPLDLDWPLLAAAYAASLQETGAAAREQAAGQLGALDNSQVMEDSAAASAAYAVDRSAEMIGRKLVDGELVDNADAAMRIDETTRDMIQADVHQALAEGWDSDQLASVLQDNYAFSEERAQLIAKQELDMATTQAHLDTWSAAGVEGKKSMLSPLHTEDDECDECADQGPIPIEEPFITGDFGPPYHLRCECRLQAVPNLNAHVEE